MHKQSGFFFFLLFLAPALHLSSTKLRIRGLVSESQKKRYYGSLLWRYVKAENDVRAVL